MACPVIKMLGKRIILLSGYRNSARAAFAKNAIRPTKVDGIRELRQCSKRNPDAVAFAYVAGRWVPAA
jgi:hypothetical protein